MNQFDNINPADNRPAASETTVEQRQPQQAYFEQQLADVQQLGPIYAHSQLYDVTQEDDRLIQAASGAALERGPPPGPTTISIYDRRLRKLAEALKKDGKSIAALDDDTLLDCAKKLLPNDKIIAPALLIVSRYRKPGAPFGSRHITVHRTKTNASLGRPPRQASVEGSTRKRPEITQAASGSWRQLSAPCPLPGSVPTSCAVTPILCSRKTRNSSTL
ncbi:hypothetical protein [Bradyrhizobium sp. USDA 4520]